MAQPYGRRGGPTKRVQAGKGFLYLDTDGKGLRYIGPTEEISIAITPGDETTYYDPDGVEQVALITEPASVSRTITFGAVDMSDANRALFLAGSVRATAARAAAGQAVADEKHTVAPGRLIMLGRTAAAPGGAGKVKVVSMKDDSGANGAAGAAIQAVSGGKANYSVDADRGQVWIPPDAPDISDGDVVYITYTPDAGQVARNYAETGDALALTGLLHYIGDSSQGIDADIIVPKCSLVADGAAAIKSTANDPQKITIRGTVLEPDDSTRAAISWGGASVRVN